MFIDTHAHYDDGRFDEDRDAVLTDMKNHGIGIIVNQGCDLPSSRMAVELAEKYDFVYAAVGIHPENCRGVTDADFAELEKLYDHPKVIAVGEIGLDYYWEEAPDGRAFQRQVLRRQLETARRRKLPVVIHDRDAHQDCMAITGEFPDVTGVFHCCALSLEDAKVLVKRGWYMGFGGSCTFKNARKAPEVIRGVPLEHLVLETDCPYLAPVPYRGRRNDSRYIPVIAQKIAEYRGCTVEEVERVTTENAKRFYGIE